MWLWFHAAKRQVLQSGEERKVDPPCNLGKFDQKNTVYAGEEIQDEISVEYCAWTSILGRLRKLMFHFQYCVGEIIFF